LSKRFTHTTDSDVPVEAVFAVLSGADWSSHLSAELGDDSKTVRRDVGSDGSVTLVLNRRLPSGIPGFLQKFLPADPRVVTTDVWGPPVDGARDCTWTADIAGTPTTITGTQRIEPLGDGNRHIVTGEVKVSVPLIGGKAEAFIAEAIRGLAESEVAVVEKVLASG
jgi:hypothetical protein